MNKRLARTAQKAVEMYFEGVFLDCYNNTIWNDTAPTITTRIYACNHYWIMEKQPSPRQQSIRARQLPNGNIRCYQDDDRKTGVSELQFTHPDNCAPTVTTQGSVKTIVEQQAIVKQVNTAALRTRSYAGKPQALEVDDTAASNAITHVTKDSMIVEQTIVSPPHGCFKGAERSIVAPTCKASAMQEQHFVKEQHLLNGDSEDNASTITTANHYSGNITNPNGGHKEMGVLEILDDTYANRDVRRYQDAAPTIRSERTGLKVSNQIRIRKLTERELFRLQDVDDGDIDILLNAGISNTQLAKLAGNSIVVNVLYHIFRTLFVDTTPPVENGQQLTLF